MLQTLRAAHLENKNWQQELFLFLRNYRATPHSNTGVSPAELLFGRKLVVKLSELVNTAPSRSLIADTNRKPKGRMKAYADTHVRRLNIAHWQLETRFSSVNHVNTNYYRPKNKIQYTITNINGTMITATNTFPETKTATNTHHQKLLPVSTNPNVCQLSGDG